MHAMIVYIGCACDVANQIAFESHRYHFDPHVYAMDEYEIVTLHLTHTYASYSSRRISFINVLCVYACQGALSSESAVIFVTSTTGQGEAPDNMQVLHALTACML